MAVLLATFPLRAEQPTDTEPWQQFVPSGGFFPKFFGEDEQDRQRLQKVQITPAEERRVGQAMLTEFLKSTRSQNSRVSKQGRDVQYVRALVDKLHPLMRRHDSYESIDVYVAETKVTDARSFPGGSIVITSGMLEFAESEAAVVGVLAHELAHIDRGHQLDSLRRTKLAERTFSGGAASPAEFMTAGRLFTSQFVRPFRPEQEVEADADAARWMAEAGYEPMEMARLFLRLHERDRHRQSPLPGFLRSHPYHIDRYRAIRDAAEKLPANQVRFVGKENLRRREPR